MLKFFQTVIIFILAVTSLMVSGCHKPNKGSEDALRISTDAPNYSETTGTDYNFQVKIESVMPPSGVKIEVLLRSETTGQYITQGLPIDTKNSTSQLRLISLPVQQVCQCTIRVISRGRPTNTASLDFRIVRK